MRDNAHNLVFKPAFSPKAAILDNTPQQSFIFDTFGSKSVTLALLTGVLTDADATFTLLLEESDTPDMSGANAVADKDLIGSEVDASFTFADDEKIRSIGYVGDKRFVKATVTPSGNSGNLFLSGMWVAELVNRPAGSAVA